MTTKPCHPRCEFEFTGFHTPACHYMDLPKDPVKLLAVPLDEISPEEMEQLRQFAEQQDWSAMRQQLIHYSKRFKTKEEENKP